MSRNLPGGQYHNRAPDRLSPTIAAAAIVRAIGQRCPLAALADSVSPSPIRRALASVYVIPPANMAN
jgi:hypothetical protein